MEHVIFASLNLSELTLSLPTQFFAFTLTLPVPIFTPGTHELSGNDAHKTDHADDDGYPHRHLT